MGIPTCRFVDQNQIGEYKCLICTDVAEDPIILRQCEHIFCESCIETCANKFKCPSCQSQFSKTIMPWKRIDGFVKRWYLKLKIKCLNPVCTKILDPANYKYHDVNCPMTFKKCDDCGYKTRHDDDPDHSCVKGVKGCEKKVTLLEEEIMENWKEVVKEGVKGSMFVLITFVGLFGLVITAIKKIG